MAAKFSDLIEVKVWPSDASAEPVTVWAVEVIGPDLLNALECAKEAVRKGAELALGDLEGSYRRVEVITSRSLLLAQYTPLWMIAPRHA